MAARLEQAGPQFDGVIGRLSLLIIEVGNNGGDVHGLCSDLNLRSPQLTKQLDGASIFTSLQCSNAADGKDRDGLKQLAQLFG